MALWVPHQVVDPGLEREVEPLVPEAQLLVVQDVADVGEVQRVEGNHRVEVDGIDRLLPGDVSGEACGDGNGEQSVLLLERGLEPVEVVLQHRDDVLEALLVADLVVEDILDIGQERDGHTFRVVGCDDGASVLDAVVGPDGSALLLSGVEEVKHVERRICLVAVVQEQGGEAGIEHVEGLLAGVRDIVSGELVLLRTGCPVLVDPDPGPVVQIHEILVVEMD